VRIALIQVWPEAENWRGRRSFFVFPPLSLMHLAAVTPAPHRVEIYDETVRRADLEGPFDLVGISTTTPATDRAYFLAAHYRSRGIPVVMGGVHATMCPDEVAEHADAVVLGEGELVWPEIIADAAAGRLQARYRASRLLEGAEIPPADRSWIRRRDYVIPYTIMATRGCPWDCSFCSTTAIWGRRYRQRPVEQVVAEIAGFRGRMFLFLDDNLFADEEYALALMARLAPLRKRWVAQADIRLAESPRLLRLAARSGCLGILVGLESNNPANLAEIQKGINDVEVYRRYVERLHAAGIRVQGSFIVGFDGDTYESARALTRFAREIGLDTANFSVLTPFPGTPAYRRYVAENRLLTRDWTKYNREDVVFRPRNMTPEQLLGVRLELYRDFYSWRSIRERMPRTLRHLPWYLMYNVTYRVGVKNIERRFAARARGR
jgi:radical SAM superfamily enzyme YgiQ (UPF0313 family)